MIWFTFPLFFPLLLASIRPNTFEKIKGPSFILCGISSPAEYEEHLEYDHFEKIRTFKMDRLFISCAVASDLASRFPKWKALKAVDFATCAWQDSANEIMASALVSNPNITKVSCNQEDLDFLPYFVRALCQAEPYLKELEVIFDFRCQKKDESLFQLDTLKLEKAFSLLEKLVIDSYNHTDERLLRKIIPTMKNLKSITLWQESRPESKLLRSFDGILENGEEFYSSFRQESSDMFLEIIPQMLNLQNLELEYLGSKDDLDLSTLEPFLVKMKKLKNFKLSGSLDGRELLPKLKNLPNLQNVTVPIFVESEENFELRGGSSVTFFNPQEYPFEVTLKMETDDENMFSTFSEPECETNDESISPKAKEFVGILPRGISDLKLYFCKVDAKFLAFFWEWLVLEGNGKDLKNFMLKFSSPSKKYDSFKSSIALFSSSYKVVKVVNSSFGYVEITITNKDSLDSEEESSSDEASNPNFI